MNKTLITLATLILSTAPTVAFASDAGGASNPFAGDIGSALWTLIIFGCVVVVLGKFAWGPILSALQKREEFIRDSLAQAKEDREDAAQQMKEYTEKLTAARAEATAIVDEGRRDAEALKHKIEDDAKSEAQASLDRAKREIELAKDTAVKELFGLGARLATDVASKIIRKELNASEHERLVEESIAELEKTG